MRLRIVRRLLTLLRWRRFEAELSEELDFHRHHNQKALEREGLSPEQAASAARRALGNATLAREDARGVWLSRWAESLWQDAAYAVRALRKSPGFTVIAGLTLAVGIGGTVAMFMVVNGVLLRPLPYQDPDRLVMLWTDNPSRDLHEEPTSYPTFEDWRARSRSFAEMSFFTPNPAVLTGGDAPERVVGQFVSAGLFPLLGVTPALGRSFSTEEEARAESVVVVSDGLWRRRFGGALDVIGKTIEIDGDANASKAGRARTSRIIGVMPPDFHFPDRAAQFWEPSTVYWRWARESGERQISRCRVVGRLRAGVSINAAQEEMTGIGRQLSSEHPTSAQDFPGFNVRLVSMLDQVTGRNLQLGVWILLGAVSFVLLIVCANVANLQLARGAVREHEIAVRSALGAGPGRLLRQLLIESLMLGSGAGVVGVILAVAAVRGLASSSLAGIPRAEQIHVDVVVWGFAAGVSLLAGLCFGLAPAWRLARTDPSGSLKDGRTGTTRGFHRARSLLIVAECLLSVMLLAGAGLLIRSFLQVQAMDMGFNPQNVLTVRFAVPLRGPQSAQAVKPSSENRLVAREAFLQEIHDGLVQLPGVTSVGFIDSLLIRGDANVSMTMEGAQPSEEGPTVQLAASTVSGDFFETIGVPLLRGRLLSRADGLDKARLLFSSAVSNPVTARRGPAEAVVVNETFVRRFIGDRDPIGRRFFDGQITKRYWYEIVGVVGDMRRQGLETRPVAEFFGSALGGETFDALIRASAAPMELAGMARQAIRSVDARTTILNVDTAENQIEALTAARRVQTGLLALFAMFALAIAATGVYGIVRYAVTQRTREIGVRLALGATTTDVRRLVVSDGMKPPIVGIVLGLLGAAALTRVMTHLLFNVSATDPTTFGAVGLVLTAVALIACWLPARRAARIDPITALRCE